MGAAKPDLVKNFSLKIKSRKLLLQKVILKSHQAKRILPIDFGMDARKSKLIYRTCDWSQFTKPQGKFGSATIVCYWDFMIALYIKGRGVFKFKQVWISCIQ